MFSQTGINICAYASFRRVDTELNNIYHQIERRLRADSDTLQRWRSAQRAWIVFRDAKCDFAASGSIGGSVHPMILSACLESITRLRIATLRGYLHCPEGDLSCPVPQR